MERTVIDLTTGVVSVVEMTPQEVEAAIARQSQEFPEPFDRRIQAAYESFSDEQQGRFEDVILKCAFFYERRNIGRLMANIQLGESLLELPGDENVKAVIDAAKAELEAML